MPPPTCADIVFLLDARPAGRPWARAVRDRLRSFFATLDQPKGASTPRTKNWRAKIVGYGTGPGVADHPFVSTAAELEAQVDDLPFAGSDEPPELLAALRTVADARGTERDAPPEPDAWCHWRNARRFAVVVAYEPFAEPAPAERVAVLEPVLLSVLIARIELLVLAPTPTDVLRLLEEADHAQLIVRPFDPDRAPPAPSEVVREAFDRVSLHISRRRASGPEIEEAQASGAFWSGSENSESGPAVPDLFWLESASPESGRELPLVPSAGGGGAAPPNVLTPKDPAHMSQLPKVKGIADIVFLLDATGSMQPCINAVKQNIKTFVQTLTTPTPNGAAVVKDWRCKVMGYRDLDYTDVPAIVDNPFVSSVAELEAQLNALTADGGGDEPETLLEALYMLANMPSTGPEEPLRPDAWRNVNTGRRFVIVFTDAPFKEPLRIPKDARIDDVILNLMTAKVVLHMFAPASLSRFSTLEEVDKALWYKIPVGPGETAQKALEDFTSDQSKFEKIIQLLAKTMTQQSGSDTPIAD